jgi:hypothetical protein
MKFLHDLPRFKPACRLTEAKVPFGMSSPIWPLTVTRPDFVGCLNCRWLPRVTTSTQPCCSSRRMTSRTFTDLGYQIEQEIGQRSLDSTSAPYDAPVKLRRGLARPWRSQGLCRGLRYTEPGA